MTGGDDQTIPGGVEPRAEAPSAPATPGAGAGEAFGEHGVATLAADEEVVERLLAGGAAGSDDPPWSAELVRLVQAGDAPARPDELAGEDAIVSRMVAVRRAALAELPVGSAPVVDVDPGATPVSRLPARRLGEPWPGGRRRQDSLVTYRAKHAAARLEASRHPAVRNLGRVLAVKAAAVTTAVVVGTVAAAAATTGIVATVVVPALTGKDPSPPPDPGRSTDDRVDRDDGVGGPGAGDGSDDPGSPTSPVEDCVSGASCTDPEAGASAASTTIVTGGSMIDPATGGTTTTTPAETTPSTESPTTTVPESPTTTVPEPTTTTVPGEAPSGLSDMSGRSDDEPGTSTAAT
jgi:hypothetical protein